MIITIITITIMGEWGERKMGEKEMLWLRHFYRLEPNMNYGTHI